MAAVAGPRAGRGGRLGPLLRWTGTSCWREHLPGSRTRKRCVGSCSSKENPTMGACQECCPKRREGFYGGIGGKSRFGSAPREACSFSRQPCSRRDCATGKHRRRLVERKPEPSCRRTTRVFFRPTSGDASLSRILASNMAAVRSCMPLAEQIRASLCRRSIHRFVTGPF